MGWNIVESRGQNKWGQRAIVYFVEYSHCIYIDTNPYVASVFRDRSIYANI